MATQVISPQVRNAAIPAELKQLHQWARCAPDKAPLNLDGTAMAWSDPANWLTFEQVSRFDRIGCFITPETGIIGIDFDGCIEENGVIHPTVKKYIDQAHTWAEISQSRRGLKLRLRAKLQNDKAIINKNVPWATPGEEHVGIEIYGKVKFFAVTGDLIDGCPSEINEAPEVLHDILVRFGPAPKTREKAPLAPTYGDWDVDRWIYQHLEVVEKLADGYIVVCPWCAEHTTPGDTARIWTSPKYTFNCFHAHCSGREWSDVRLKHEPTAYDKRDQWTNYSPGQDHSSNRNGNKEQGIELPSVILGGQLRESRDESLEYLGKSEESEPTIFVQSGRLVQIGRDKDHKAVIMHMGVPEIKNALTKAADFFTLRKKGDEVELKPASPPKEIAEAILALSPSKWPFKPLEAIIETPVIRPDGTILQTPGYDDLTKLYYAPHKDMQACNVPESPTKKEAQKALAVLQDIIADFPFVDRPDYTNMLALLITPIIRPAIKRHVPLALIDAPKQGAGKGLLSDIVAIIATGSSAPIMPAPKNDEEWDKKLPLS